MSRQNQLAHKDLTGMRFGHYTVVRKGESDASGSYWICRCDCGKESRVRGYDLYHGRALRCKSCAQKGAYLSRRHAETHKPESICWSCQRAVNTPEKECSWSIDFTPVKGWEAKTSIIRNAGNPVETFCVIKCPQYVGDKEEKI